MKIIAAIRHYLLFGIIAAHVALRYLPRLKPQSYIRFLRRAALLMWVFRHNRIVKVKAGYKLQLYLPPWPSRAFFDVLENKLLHTPPAPISLVFSMTRACGYNCPHCYQKLEKDADLEASLLLQTLEATLNTGVRFFNLEGGEPFMRFERLKAMLKLTRNRAEVWVNTTGHGLDGDKLQQALALGLAGLMVSIHSTDPAVHDRFTGTAGSFATACNAIKQAKQLGLAVAVNSVLSEAEIKHGGIAKLMELSRKLKADFVQLIHPKPCGGWLTHADMQSDPELHKFVESRHRHYNSHHTWSYPALATQVFEERVTGVGCTAGGVDRFYISAGGEVQPCEFLQISFGNVREEAFDAIFARMRKAFATPCTSWLCCTQSRAIAQYMHEQGLNATPLGWPHTQQLIKNWQPGVPTPLYAKLGIYDQCK